MMDVETWIAAGGGGAVVTILWAVLRRVPALLVAATELLRESRQTTRDLRVFLRHGSAAAALGEQVLRHQLEKCGIKPEVTRDPHDSDELAIVRDIFEGREDRALAELESLSPEESLPMRLTKDAQRVLDLIRKVQGRQSNEEPTKWSWRKRSVRVES